MERAFLFSEKFIKEHPEYTDIILDKCTSSLDKNYVTPAYKSVGREAAGESKEGSEVFMERFGSGWRYMEKLFFDAHDPLPAPETDGNDMNTYEFWEKMVEKYGKGAVIEV